MGRSTGVARGWLRAGLLVVAGGTLVVTGWASKAEDVKAQSEGIIFERQQTMHQLGEDAALLGKIVAGEAPADKLAETTRSLAQGAHDSVEAFKQQVPGGHAKPETWANYADFSARMQKFATGADAMAAAGKTGEAKQSQSSDESEATDAPDTEASAASDANTDTGEAIATVLTAIVAPNLQAPVAPSSATGTAGGNAGPLTIAAAAIAASNAVTGAEATPGAAATDAATKAAAEPPGTTPANAAEVIATTAEGTPSEDAAATQTAALTAAAPQRATSKTASSAKISTASRDATISSDQAEGATTTTDSPSPDASAAAAAAPGTEATEATRSGARNAHLAQGKAEAAGPQAQPAATAHLNPAGHDTAPTPSNTPADTAQAAISFQPPVQAAATQAQSSLTVAAATPSAAVPISGLALEIAASVRSGKSRFEIRLDPAELGRIDVRIDVDHSGRVTSHLTVERPETLSMLRQDAPQLQRALNDAGLSTGDGGLQFSLRDQSSSGQNGDQSNPNARRLILTEEDPVPAAIAGSYGRMLGGNSGVDIRV